MRSNMPWKVQLCGNPSENSCLQEQTRGGIFNTSPGNGGPAPVARQFDPWSHQCRVTVILVARYSSVWKVLTWLTRDIRSSKNSFFRHTCWRRWCSNKELVCCSTEQESWGPKCHWNRVPRAFCFHFRFNFHCRFKYILINFGKQEDSYLKFKLLNLLLLLSRRKFSTGVFRARNDLGDVESYPWKLRECEWGSRRGSGSVCFHEGWNRWKSCWESVNLNSTVWKYWSRTT